MAEEKCGQKCKALTDQNIHKVRLITAFDNENNNTDDVLLSDVSFDYLSAAIKGNPHPVLNTAEQSAMKEAFDGKIKIMRNTRIECTTQPIKGISNSVKSEFLHDLYLRFLAHCEKWQGLVDRFLFMVDHDTYALLDDSQSGTSGCHQYNEIKKDAVIYLNMKADIYRYCYYETLRTHTNIEGASEELYPSIGYYQNALFCYKSALAIADIHDPMTDYKLIPGWSPERINILCDMINLEEASGHEDGKKSALEELKRISQSYYDKFRKSQGLGDGENLPTLFSVTTPYEEIVNAREAFMAANQFLKKHKVPGFT